MQAASPGWTAWDDVDLASTSVEQPLIIQLADGCRVRWFVVQVGMTSENCVRQGSQQNYADPLSTRIPKTREVVVASKKLPPKAQDALPDSTSPDGPCPRCHRMSNFGLVGSLPVAYEEGRYAVGQGGHAERISDQRVSVLQCFGCKQNVVVVEELFIGGVPSRSGRNSGGVAEWRGMHWWPTPGMSVQDRDVPPAVADAVAEGTRCLAVRAPRAAVVMFRGALAEVVSDRGAPAAQTKHSLAGQLKQMATDGDLDRALADWADHIRVIGNAGAHPNTLASVSMDEAEDLSRLLSSLLEYLYVNPARVQRARNVRSG